MLGISAGSSRELREKETVATLHLESNAQAGGLGNPLALSGATSHDHAPALVPHGWANCCWVAAQLHSRAEQSQEGLLTRQPPLAWRLRIIGSLKAGQTALP
jgi:hypothetical protein